MKKIFSAFLIMVLCFMSFVGCQNHGDNSTENGSLDITVSSVSQTLESSELSESSEFSDVQLPNLDYVYIDNDDNGVTITKYLGTEKDVTIPQTIEGKTVTKIGSSAFAERNIISVSLPESVVEIFDSAFATCEHLKTVSLNQNLKSIDAQAFAMCPKLTEITLPESIEHLGSMVFYGSGIKELSIPENIKKITILTFSGAYDLEKLIFEGDAPESFINDEYGLKALDNCNFTVYFNEEAQGFSFPRWHGISTRMIGNNITPLTYNDFEYTETESEIIVTKYLGSAEEVIVPHTINGKIVTVISHSAFAQNDKIISVDLPENIERIEERAFVKCKALETINLPEALTYIGSFAFDGCDSIETVILPESVVGLGEYAFAHMTSLKTVYIPKSIKEFGKCVFYCSYVEEVTLADGLNIIGEYTFANTKIIEIIIPKSVTSIGGCAFDECSDLIAVKFDGDAPTFFGDDCTLGRIGAKVFHHSGAKGFDATEWNNHSISIW